MKYKVRITKQPKYQDGGSRTLGDFSNLTEDQLENGLVYGFRPEPEIQLEHPLNNIERLSDVSAPLIPVSKPEIRGISVDIPSSVSKSKYTGVSIVDYLKSIGLPSSFKYRKELAKINNIKNYTGTAAQNLKLLSIINNEIVNNTETDYPKINTPRVNTQKKSVKQIRPNQNIKITNAGLYNVVPTDAKRKPFQSEVTFGASGPIKINGKYVGSKIDPYVYEKNLAATAALVASPYLARFLIPSVSYYKLLRELPKPKLRELPEPRNLPTAPPRGWTTGSGLKSPGFPFYQYGGDMMMQQQGGNPEEQIMQVIQAYAQQSGVDPETILLQLQKMQPEEQQQVIMQMYQELQGGESQNYDMGYDTPMAAYGGQMGYGLDLGARRLWMNQDDDESSQINDTIEEVPREEANIEAEGGETAMIPYKEGGDAYMHKKIKGKRHTEGGVPLNVPEGTFIFSDTKKMKLGGSVLKLFGKSEKSTKKFTPATLAKQYNIDKYISILNDSKSDPIKKRTAELMIQNYEKKLAQLALVQEGKKGFPQGIPQVSQSYYQQMMQAQQGEEQEMQQEVPQQTQAMYGMGFKYGGGLQKFQGDKGSSEFRGVPYAYNEPMYTTNDFSGRQDEDEDLKENEESNEFQRPSLTLRTTPKTNSYDITMPESNVPSFKPFNSFDFQSQLGKNQERIDKLGQSGLLSEEERNFTDENGNIIGSNVMYHNYTKNHPYTFNFNLQKNKDFKEKDYVYNHNTPYGWTTPDKLNMLNSMINLASVRRSTPFEPTVQFQRPQTYYTDPSRALAANAEQMNAARQAAGMFAGPQSRYSFNAGQFGKNAADIIGQYAMQNVGLGNQAAQQNAAITNQQIQYDAQRAKRLYDAGIIDFQQYQNAMRQARAAVVQSYAQGDTNAVDMYNTREIRSPYFTTDLKGRVKWRGPDSAKQFYNSQNDQKNNFASLYQDAVKSAEEQNFSNDKQGRKEKQEYINSYMRHHTA